MYYFKNIRTLKYFIRKIIKPDEITHLGVRLSVGDHTISDWIRDAIYKGFYEYAEGKLLEKYAHSDDRVLEIGGGIGFIGAKCKVCQYVAIYEANPDLIPIISKNISNNEVNAKIINKAVTNNDSYNFIEINIGDHFWNASIMENNLKAKKVKVPAVSLHKILKEHNPTFLIVDVEGYEIELFNNIKFSKNVCKILIEYHPEKVGFDKTNLLREYFKKQGFTVVAKSRDSELMIRSGDK